MNYSLHCFIIHKCFRSVVCVLFVGDLYNGPPGGIVDGVLEDEMSGDKTWAEEADVPYTFHDEDADVDESGNMV